MLKFAGNLAPVSEVLDPLVTLSVVQFSANTSSRPLALIHLIVHLTFLELNDDTHLNSYATSSMLVLLTSASWMHNIRLKDILHAVANSFQDTGKNLEGYWGGRSPKNLRWGDDPRIRSPIFQQLLLLDVSQGTN